MGAVEWGGGVSGGCGWGGARPVAVAFGRCCPPVQAACPSLRAPPHSLKLIPQHSTLLPRFPLPSPSLSPPPNPLAAPTATYQSPAHASNLSLPALPSHFSPYRYGHITETSVNPDGSADVQKRYTLGRAAWELS